jgi:hypothetical protein
MRVIDRPDMRALTPLGAMDEAHDELKAYKRKAKAQRDNWKARAILAESQRDKLMQSCQSDGYACYRTKGEGMPCTVENCPVLKVKQ